MTVVVLAVGTTGDVWPMIAIANRLALTGRPVRVATHDVFRPLVERQGLEFASVPPADSLSVLRTHNGGVLLDPARAPIEHYRALTRLYGELFDDVASACVEASADASFIVRSTLSLIGLHIAQARRIRSADIHLQPTRSREYAHPLAYQYVPPRLLDSAVIRRASHGVVERLLHRPFARDVRRWRRKLGLSPSRSTTFALGRALGETRIHLYSEQLVPRPPDWGPRDVIAGSWEPSQHSITPVSVPIRGDFLLGSFGSLTPPGIERIAGSFAEAAHSLGLATVWAGASIQRSDITEVSHSEFASLLPAATAVVHHGGSGTTGLALRRGIPQVVAPLFYDQFFWASRVASRGVGVDSRGASRASRRFLEERLASAISMREAASTAAVRALNEDGTTAAAEAIERVMEDGL